ncbi:MAG: trigger factor [Wigglesworthia glossinidia]|nr:trigger factor [Wigglesworthia glossinidia]
MKISMKKISDIKRKIEIIISSNLVEKEISNALNKMQKTVCIDGFRRGKIPKSFLKNRYEPNIRKNVLNSLINKNFSKFINNHNIYPVGKLDFIITNNATTSDYHCYVHFEIYPKINEINFSNIKIKKPIIEITSEDLDFTMNKLRSEYVRWEKSILNIKKYDKVTINIKPIQKNIIFNGNIPIITFIIGKQVISSELEKQIIRKKLGGSFVFSLSHKIINIEKKHQNNIIIDFLISIINVEKNTFPKLTSQFFKEININHVKSSDEIKNKLRQNIKNQLEYFSNTYIKKQIFNAIIKSNHISIPQQLINEEIKLFLESTNKYKLNKFSGLDFLPFLHKKLIENLKHQVKSKIVFKKISFLNKTKIDHHELSAVMHNILKINKIPEKKWEAYKKNKNFIQKSLDIALQNKTLKDIIQKINYTEEKLTFKNFIQNLEQN